MDLQKEREAFEKAFAQTEFYRNKADLYSLLADIDDETFDFFRKNGFGDYSIGEAQAAWSAWQAAKSQAVPDLGELQERIAGHQYCHDEHGHMIVDMDDVVKEISGFDSWKAQAVPEGFVLVPKEPTEAMIQRGTKANSECLNENAPLGERLFRHPALQVYQAMVNGSGE